MRRYVVLVPLLLIAAPASAQIWSGTSGISGGISGGTPARLRPSVLAPVVRETGQIRADIRNGRKSGQLTSREARQLRREAFRIDSLTARYGHDGLSDAEGAELAVRRQLLRDAVIAKRSRGAK